MVNTSILLKCSNGLKFQVETCRFLEKSNYSFKSNITIIETHHSNSTCRLEQKSVVSIIIVFEYSHILVASNMLEGEVCMKV